MSYDDEQGSVLIAASNLQEDSLVNLEFSWLHLPASRMAILNLLTRTIESDVRIRPILEAWAASGDLNDGAEEHRRRLSGARLWLATSRTTLDGVRTVAERLALRGIPPDFVIASEEDAARLSRSLGH